MAHITVIPPSRAEGPLREGYARIGRTRGEVANILQVQSLNPAAMTSHLELYRAVMFGPSPLSRAERETVAVAVSALNDCHY